MSRTSILREILAIEEEIKKIQQNSVYQLLSKNLSFLKSPSNRGYISVPSPENFDTTIKVRKDSVDMVNLLSEYQKMIEKFSDRLTVLYIKRRDLKNKIFA